MASDSDGRAVMIGNAPQKRTLSLTEKSRSVAILASHTKPSKTIGRSERKSSESLKMSPHKFPKVRSHDGDEQTEAEDPAGGTFNGAYSTEA